MLPNDIQIKMFTRGVTCKRVAEELGFTIMSVSNVVRFVQHNFEIQTKIAEILREDPKELWGNHFAPVYRKCRKQKDFQQPASVAG